MGIDQPPEYAEDLPGLEVLPSEVREYLREQRQFWRQVRGDGGPTGGRKPGRDSD